MAEFVVPPNQREFHCVHCEGRILIPKDLPPTTGPCPHCGGVITSPGDEEPAAPPPVRETAAAAPPPPPPPPAEVARPVEPTPEPAPVATLPPDEKPSALELEPRSDVSERNKPKKPGVTATGRPDRKRWFLVLLVIFGLLAIIAAAVFFAVRELRSSSAAAVPGPAPRNAAQEAAHYASEGWKSDAYVVLRDFMAATTAAEKQQFVLHGGQLAEKMQAFYGAGPINDSDTPAEGFSPYELSEEDQSRGLFMMIYDQPPQVEMGEFFRPLASLEVQYGLDEADLLLSSLARVENFAMEPLKVHAFFKRTGDRLKLDWEIFAQTKYRTLQKFVELPQVGESEVFRVFVVEDVPDQGRAVAGTRTYRVVDPANTTDSARVNVKVDSEVGRALSLINWRGTATETRPDARTATVELKWAGETNAPELEISRFICWEFLGLGGEDPAVTAASK